MGNVQNCKDKIGKDLYHRLKSELKISLKHILFIAEYVTNGFNAVQAYLKTMSRKNPGEKSYNAAGVESHTLLKKPKIQQAIRLIIDDWLDEKKLKLERKIIDVLYARAFYDPLMFVDLDGNVKIKSTEEIDEKWRCCIDGIERKYYGKDADRHTVVLRLANKENALRELSKYIELFSESTIEMKMSEDTIERLNTIFNENNK